MSNNKPFVVVTASYNNAEWCRKNLESIFAQQYDNWRLIYINDCSTDATGKLVSQFIRECGLQDRVELINNTTRRGHLANQYDAICSCANSEIVVIVDGDDFLAHDTVLSYLNNTYQDPNVWLTYGQFKHLNRNFTGYCKKMPDDVIRANAIRDFYPSVFGHLRTFYAGLFKLISREDLLHDSSFFPVAADVATMIPMAEMAGERVRFIPDILYLYNDANPLSFFHDKKKEREQLHLESIIRTRRRYEPLEEAVFL